MKRSLLAMAFLATLSLSACATSTAPDGDPTPTKSGTPSPTETEDTTQTIESLIEQISALPCAAADETRSFAASTETADGIVIATVCSSSAGSGAEFFAGSLDDTAWASAPLGLEESVTLADGAGFAATTDGAVSIVVWLNGADEPTAGEVVISFVDGTATAAFSGDAAGGGSSSGDADVAV